MSNTTSTSTESRITPPPDVNVSRTKVKVATIWLEGCSGCHMSFLDIDERLIDLAGMIEMVYSPLVDQKHCPEQIDVTIVEGGASTDEDVKKLRKLRSRSKLVVSLGDCAITGNVPAMRNSIPLKDVFDRAYVENAATQRQHPATRLPVLLPQVRPVHEVIKVDVHIPGCPPPADAIWYVLSELLAGRTPDVAKVTRFGK
jgi:NAD-reducing hydrogenase small subunit